MEFLLSLHDALPWYLQLDGSGRLREILIEWGANRGIVRGDNWTQLLTWLLARLGIVALFVGVGAALLVIKRSPHGRLPGDPGKVRDAVFTGVLWAATGMAVAVAVVFLLFLAAAVGPGPLLWAGALLLAVRFGRRQLRRSRRKSAARASASAA
jgi:hypothetical protein